MPQLIYAALPNIAMRLFLVIFILSILKECYSEDDLDKLGNDIILPMKVVGKKQFYRMFGTWQIQNWPNGVIPYEILYSYSEEELSHLYNAFGEFHKKTCIRFGKKNPN